ncbi:probable WRKY transcription factor 14 [Musa acuminata AAA Group]|uniref:probable WRKY transcription factor 14 n=1 Tax=Musa acuminata AAA Group TaxID=214697 RepID=UPI0031D419F5
MCDYFWQRRENGQGDLADVVRSGGSASASGSEFPVVSDWHPPSEQTVPPSSSTVEDMNNDFGDPFANLCDPLLSELTGIEFFHNSGEMITGGQVKAATESTGGGGGGGIMSQQLLMSEEMITKPRDIIPRAFQLSSGGAKPSPLSPIEASSGAVGCSADDGGVQISSTRSLGVKRRKNQAKKVVCIPAPAAATNRSSGEVVPSDLWAWRKYGQKPIKGSPYPRGYYRCSSSKGCSARKQVERSRTNPNMLVITYTSEHNHPWPTQRNALAGSTRSQASKNSSSASKTSFGRSLVSPTAPKADPKVKEEEEAAEIDNESMIPESNHPDDFFADLAELETDPMSTIFSKVLIHAKQPEEEEPEEEEPENKGLGPLNMW